MKSAAYFEQIRTYLASPSRERVADGVFQYNIKCEDGGVHAIIFDEKNSTLVETTSEKIDATIDVSDDDFVLLVTKKLFAKEALAEGRMTISGNKELGEKLFQK